MLSNTDHIREGMATCKQYGLKPMSQAKYKQRYPAKELKALNRLDTAT